MHYNKSMGKRIGIKGRYYRLRGRIGRTKRLLFISPAEVRLIELMGGKVCTLAFTRLTVHDFPLAIVMRNPKVFKNEHVKRELRIGKYYVDFGNDVGRAIEVDGQEYHMDILADLQRDSYLIERGWRVKHIQAYRLWRDADKVQREVLDFLLE